MYTDSHMMSAWHTVICGVLASVKTVGLQACMSSSNIIITLQCHCCDVSAGVSAVY